MDDPVQPEHASAKPSDRAEDRSRSLLCVLCKRSRQDILGLMALG